MAENERGGGTYIVFLPWGVPVQGYGLIRKVARTDASSERDAVSNVIFRSVDKTTGRLVMHALDERYGGVQNYAVILPPVSSTPDSEGLTHREHLKAMEYTLAQELWSKKGFSGSPSIYFIQKARNLLEDSLR